MKYLRLFIYVILFFLLNDCSSSTESTSQDSNAGTSPLILIKSSNLEINTPSGWKEINDNHDKLFDIWLVDDEANASIGFIPININDDIDLLNQNEILDFLEKIVITVKNNLAELLDANDEQIFDLKYKVKQIRLVVDDKIQNVIIFGEGDNYFESIAYFHKEYNPTESEIKALIRTQHNIIKHSKIK